MGASRVAGGVYFSLCSSCPETWVDLPSWLRLGPAPRGWREGSGMGGAGRGAGGGSGTVVQLRRPYVARRGVARATASERGDPRAVGGGQDDSRARARPWPAQRRDPAAGTVLRSSDNGAREAHDLWMESNADELENLLIGYPMIFSTRRRENSEPFWQAVDQAER